MQQMIATTHAPAADPRDHTAQSSLWSSTPTRWPSNPSRQASITTSRPTMATILPQFAQPSLVQARRRSLGLPSIHHH